MDRSTDAATHDVTLRTTTVPMSLDEAVTAAAAGRGGRIGTALHAELERLRSMLGQDGDALAWLLIREHAVVDAWRNLHPTARAAVPVELAAELDEMAEHRDDPADTSGGRELARLRAVEAAAQAWAAEPSRLDGADVTPAGEALLDALDGGAPSFEVVDRDEAARLRGIEAAARHLLRYPREDVTPRERLRDALNDGAGA